MDASSRVVAASVDRLMCDDEESCVDDVRAIHRHAVERVECGGVCLVGARVSVIVTTPLGKGSPRLFTAPGGARAFGVREGLGPFSKGGN